MISTITRFHHQIWSNIESRLIPRSEEASLQFFDTLLLVVEFPIGIAVSCVQTINKIIACVPPLFRATECNPKEDFLSVVQDAREWEKLEDIESKIAIGKGNPHFLFGTATCTYQDSGSFHCPNSQWSYWEKNLPENNRSGRSADLFEFYKTEQGRKKITDALHQLGVNSYRFSIEWSHIEPHEGVWNESNLQIYLNLCLHLRNEQIIPMITLHHFSEPLWFHEKGSFEKEENHEGFVRFSEKIFHLFTKSYRGKPMVEYFCTINEPAIDSFSRFVRGSFSPGIMLNFARAARFLRGALQAHSVVYKKLKPYSADSVKIGIVHQYLRFIPSTPLLFPITHYLTRLVNEVAMDFFRTGTFTFTMPFVHVSGSIINPKTDFCGLQYYTRPYIGLFGSTTPYSPMTQMPFREDPEGIYEASIQVYQSFKVPIIVTENGISTRDEAQRNRYLARSLYALDVSTREIGTENLLGFYLWSFSDNFEWDMGMNPQAFGAFTISKQLKDGARIYTRIIRSWERTIQPIENSI